MKFIQLNVGIVLFFLLVLLSCNDKRHEGHSKKKCEKTKGTSAKIKTVFGPWQTIEKETINQSGDAIGESMDSLRTTKHRRSPLKDETKIK